MTFVNRKNPETGKFEKIEIPSEKETTLQNISLSELLESDEDYSDLDYKGSKLGELLSDKFFGGNIYKELQLHRNMFEILKKVVITKEELSAEDIAKLQELEEMNVDAEKLLNKFKK